MAKLNLKVVQAALAKKQADLDMVDEEIMGMPEMAPDAPADMGTSPEFDLLSQKREELEEEITKMHEGVQLISEWEKFKGGPWSEEVKQLLGEIDVEISDIASDEIAPGSAMPEMGAEPPVVGAPAPAVPEAPIGGEGTGDTLSSPAAPAPEESPVPEAGTAEPAPIEPPMASVKAGKSPTSKKNSYQSPDKKGVSARSDMKKEGSNMANPTPAKASVQEKLADTKTKRESIKREAQQRVAAAWTIAKTMLPEAPAEVQKSAAANLLQNPTRVLNAMLRQTAKNAHYSKLAETFKQVHKVELNDLLEDPSVLHAEKKAVESEIKGDAKNAAAKSADDRKDAGPQTSTYNDGRGCGGGKHTEPKQMDAGSSASQTEAEGRPMDTVNKSEGDSAKKTSSKEAAVETKTAKKCECKGECKCEEKKASEKTAKCDKCGTSECDHKHAAESCGADCKGCDKCAASKKAAIDASVEEKKAAQSKKADEPMAEATAPADMGAEAPPEAPMDAAPAEEAPMGEEPLGEEPMADEGDSSAEVLSDEKKMIVEEKIEEAQEAIQALEQEILQEGEEELDLSQVFNEDEMEEKVSALANEGDEHTAGNGEEFFAPSAAESMEASLDEPQMASMEDFFSLKGSDSDPLAHLIAGEIKTAEQVAGMEVVPSFTGEAAKHFESDTATGDTRDNENDHDGDLFAEAIEDQKPEDGGFKRVKQDETNVMEAPKSAAKTASAKKETPKVIKKLKPVVASEQKPIDIASALFGNDEF
jgi:hypothetical protein